jgi:pimeloyl-ACP methyl ester carboxylesterase/molybdopterin/thiamine biosynthesis adenylyltransferase
MHDGMGAPATDSVYEASFSRNIGILTREEQDQLSRTTVLVVGAGGIGSNCLLTLARMGVGGFHIVDPDTFELANINRQLGATVSTTGRSKVDVMRDAILDINPQARVTVWHEYFTPDLSDQVFDGAHIAIDAIDFYRIDDHVAFHAEARKRSLYVLMGSPVGFSATLQVFDPNGMTLEDYCGLKPKMDAVEKQLRYACGIVPRLAHISYYDVSKQNSNTDFLKGSGPSLASACSLAAALVATEVALIVLNRRKPRAIPHTLQHDPYTYRHEAVYVDGGMPAYDPTDVLEAIEDKSSLVVNIFDFFYRKVRAATLDLPDGGRLCYRSEGKGHPVLLIPPVGGDTSFWARQTPALSAHHRVITLDHRGIGRSSALPATADTTTLAADVIALIEHLQLDRVVLVGCALGGLVALQCALSRRDLVAGVSVLAGYLEADATIVGTTDHWRYLARRKGMTAVFDDSIDWLFGDGYRAANADELYKLKTFYRVNEQHPDEFIKQSLIANRFRPDGDLSSLQCPVQILHGGADRLVGPHHARQLADAIGGVEPVILEDAGHFLTWERAATVNGLLDGFIRTSLQQGSRT